jgi:uroporphyrin-3 C-methyltransferase
MAVFLAGLATAALVLAWNAQQRVKSLEFELVKRQQDSANQAAEARTLARQAESVAREAAARMAVLDARVAETSLQRTQIEELVQSLARSRDENVLADIDNALRLAMQQAAITGSVEPLVTTLRQADERLARYSQPRLEQVRRALAQDLDRVRAAGTSDIGVLALRIDEITRVVDTLPMLAQADRSTAQKVAAAPARAASGAQPPALAPAADVPAPNPAAAARAAPAPAPAPQVGGGAVVSPGASAPAAAVVATAEPEATGWAAWLGQRGRALLAHVWAEARALVRVTRIDDPATILLAPEQAWFLRENLKLRLLNARLALLSRQFDAAQLDLREAQSTVDRYFDRSARRVQQTSEQLAEVAAEARAVTVPRPDATLAAIATASAGR